MIAAKKAPPRVMQRPPMMLPTMPIAFLSGRQSRPARGPFGNSFAGLEDGEVERRPGRRRGSSASRAGPSVSREAGTDGAGREIAPRVIDRAAPGAGVHEVPAGLVRIHAVDELPLPGPAVLAGPVDQPRA